VIHLTAKKKKTMQPMTSDTTIMLFVKAPIQGHVKTRLAKDLDACMVTGLYKCFVDDIIHKITAARLPLIIFYDPPGSLPMMRAWLGDSQTYSAQTGNTLGDRMEQAFRHVYRAGTRRAVLLGSDLPDLPGKTFTLALSALDTHDAVIGPSSDGGYYLIGFTSRAFTARVFQEIRWSTDAVYQATLDRFAEGNLSIKQLPPWRDIDTLNDLLALIESLKKNPGRAPKTAAYLKQSGMMG
jgi:rSAM/selenodomain-associated transferase 1